jgi:hypothetical protein
VPDLATRGDGHVGEGEFGRDEVLVFHLDAVHVLHGVARDLFFVVFERASPCAFFGGEAVVCFFLLGLLSRFCRQPVRDEGCVSRRDPG